MKEIIIKGNYNLLFFYLEENENDNRNDDDKGNEIFVKISIISDLKKREQFRILEKNKPFNLSPSPSI